MSSPARTIAELLVRQAARHPERAALVAGDGHAMNYHALRERVVETSALLREVGVARNDHVVVAMPNGVELAVTMLSVMAAATAVPLDHDTSPEERERYLGCGRVRAVVVSEASSAVAQAATARELPVLVVSTGSCGLIGGRSGPAAGDAPLPDDTALVLHTSGTTGEPKFVPLRQFSLCLSAATIASSLRLTEADRCLNVMPLTHAHGLLTPLLATLTAGGSVVCLPGFTVDDFYAALAQLRPTWYSAVPTIHEEILAHADRYDAGAVPPLRFVRSASSALSRSALARLESTFRAPLIEAYGMTETTSVVASNPVPPGERKPGSVGVAVGCEIEIHDRDGRSLPVNEIGEVVVRGPTVAVGHGDEGQQNAAADGWFATGDLGRLDEDGYLFLVGRTKETINRGGLTISPVEIEQVLRSHPCLAQVVAFPVPHPSLGEDVAVAVVPGPGQHVTEYDIRAFAAGHLSQALMPGKVVVVDEIPLGPTGKLQRLRLHERLAMPSATFVAPATGLQETLVAIWRDVLHREQIGIHDNFFDAGGDSLRASQVCEEIARRSGAVVSVIDLFAFSTIALLTEFLEPAAAETASTGLAGTVRAGRERLARRRGHGGGHA